MQFTKISPTVLLLNVWERRAEENAGSLQPFPVHQDPTVDLQHYELPSPHFSYEERGSKG